ncbi:MAG: SLAC1 anion channel family protein [Melioribacteraceae bacterium]|nr:SLAC1 anion channel family protein [Melioribacteraceae bacterium]
MKSKRLEHFTVSFFSIFLGLGGFSLLMQKAENLMRFPFAVSNYLFGFTVFLYVLVLILFLVRMYKFPKAVNKEYHHPIKVNFFATISIAPVIFSIFLIDLMPATSKYLLIAGSSLHLFFTLSVISAWTKKNSFLREHLNPAWFIPIVGNILIPVAGTAHFHKDISWFFFSIGIIYWIILYTIIQNRIIFHKILPEKLRPTLFIFIAPPAIGFIAYVKLTGNVDSFARILYFFSLFLFIKLIFQLKLLLKLKFYLSWWAFSFPLAALGLASSLMFHKTEIYGYKYFVYYLLSVLTIVILILSYKTIAAAVRHELCVSEEE